MSTNNYRLRYTQCTAERKSRCVCVVHGYVARSLAMLERLRAYFPCWWMKMKLTDLFLAHLSCRTLNCYQMQDRCFPIDFPQLALRKWAVVFACWTLMMLPTHSSSIWCSATVRELSTRWTTSMNSPSHVRFFFFPTAIVVIKILCTYESKSFWLYKMPINTHARTQTNTFIDNNE